MGFKTIHGKLARGTNFMNMGVLLISMLLLIKSLAAETSSPLAIIPPAIAYTISAIIAVYSLLHRSAHADRYVFFRDGFPLFMLMLCTILAGGRHLWVWLVLGFSAASILFFLITRGRGDAYD